MTRFSAETLDLSRFPAPLAIRGIDYEGLLAARKTRLISLFQDRDIAYDVERLESDPAIILEETDAYRELLAYAAINDAVRACMVAFAVGSDLDHLAAFYGVLRRPGESDAEFRRRVLLAPEAMATAGPRGAYVYHALTADQRVHNVDVWTPKPGTVVVALQSREADGIATSDMIGAVRDYLYRDDIKPLTDVVVVRSVTNFTYRIKADVYIAPGPDPIMVRDQVLQSLQAMAASRRTPARDVPRSAIYAAAQIGPVDKVVLHEPTVDIARDYGEVGICTGIEIKVTTYAG